MPTPGLSLVGFMERQQAINYLAFSCVPEDPSEAALVADWQAAAERLGPAAPNAGRPQILDPPPEAQDYLARFMAEPWVAAAFQGPALQGSSFKLVEIEPLLALQFHIDTNRTGHHCDTLRRPCNLEHLLPVCLPMTQPDEIIHISPISPHSQTALIKTRNTALQMRQAGVIQTQDAAGYKMYVGGMVFNFSLPFAHVVRFNERCYLHNGFHRVLGASKAGATHIPCVFRDVATAEAANIQTDGTTFTLALLESDNPPTVGHFTRDRAHQVRLRAFSRILHVSWAQYTMPDE